MNAKTTTKTTTKTTKAARNTPVKATAAKPLSLVAFIVAGIEARKASAFYKSAFAYHKKAATVFPRERNNETRKALKMEDAQGVFAMHDKSILSAGNKQAQSMLDVFMMQASKATK